MRVDVGGMGEAVAAGDAPGPATAATSFSITHALEVATCGSVFGRGRVVVGVRAADEPAPRPPARRRSSVLAGVRLTMRCGAVGIVTRGALVVRDASGGTPAGWPAATGSARVRASRRPDSARPGAAMTSTARPSRRPSRRPPRAPRRARRRARNDPFRRLSEGVRSGERSMVPALSREGGGHDHGPGDRTSSAETLVTVAGLCRIHTGFADPRSCVMGCARESTPISARQAAAGTMP